MTSLGEMAMDHQPAVDDEDMPDRAPVLAGPPLTEDPQPVADPATVWAPDDTAMPSRAEEPAAGSQDDLGQPIALSAPDAEPEPVLEPPAAIAADSMSTRWRDIQMMFIDDPRSSAEMAASLVDDSVQELVALVREQQDSLLAAWHDQDTGTEELRTAVQHYRTFGTRLADFCREG